MNDITSKHCTLYRLRYQYVSIINILYKSIWNNGNTQNMFTSHESCVSLVSLVIHISASIPRNYNVMK